ncbi:MAG TPA: 3-isopropylmalate dehydrogenase [Rhodospirillaceae bacterium]|nr:3-isopropylmalate dehydrogenase [Rhodospirillaceae bacterium]HAA92779.1 3-isopropylmalate dehydrogenase [Rhodospirillaceae bacterium]HAT35203.1 3-isopropylmalate dehydrogenase [Rhodospirillaceae bacterium]
MTANRTILMLPGDYIGPEVTEQVRRVVDWMGENRAIRLDVDEDYFGGAAVDAYGTPLADETLDRAKEVDAVLLGAVGGPKYDELPRDKRPEAGLLRLRKEMDLFANLRPAITFDALLDASSLKPDVVKGLDIMIVRELTSGIYFGEPRGIEGEDGSRMAVDTQRYHEHEIVRVAEVAFELARERGGKLHSVEKENVMATGILWREVVTKMHQERYSDVELHHLYVDNCAMQLVRDPTQFDVIVTDNMFGDILSDCASMVTGSLGMLPSASLGAPDETGRRLAVYEPVHGSAPDIAGQNLANPLAAILSFAMMLRYSLDLPDEAQLIETAIGTVLDGGMRTADIMEDGAARVSTDVMGDALLQELAKSAA